MARRVNPHDIRRGAMLLAEPYMIDPHFKRSVILLTDHSQVDGTVGFILNKPLDVKINDLIDDFPEIESSVYLWWSSSERNAPLHP